MKRIGIVTLTASLMSWASVAAQPSLTELLAQSPTYDSVILSPDGKSMAVAVYQDDKRSMLCIDRASGAVKSAFKLAGQDEVGEFFWANDTRLLVKINSRTAWEKQTHYYGEMYGVNCDGSDKELLFGYRRGNIRMSDNNQTRFAWSDIIHLIPDDPNHVLISSTPWTSDGASKSQIMLLDVNTAQLKPVDRAPIEYSTVLADRTGKPRVAMGITEKNTQMTYVAGDEPGQWQMDEQLSSIDNMVLQKMLPDGSGFYFSGRQQTDLINLYKYDFASKKISVVYQSKTVDATWIQFATDGEGIYAVRTDDGFPSYVLQDLDSEDTKIFRSLLQKFNGLNVTLTSRTRDGNLWVAKVSADNVPPTYYLLDRGQKSLKRLFDSRPELQGAKFAMTDPVEFKSADGLAIHGYLTKPLATTAKAPMVVLVHGGPYNVRDYWGFDTEVQMLAANGYQVLQVNYRGSEGYGQAFADAANLHWGDTVQQDIIAGAKWAVSQGLVDADNLCIMGGSFGGYSALQSASLAPEQFKCAIGVAGIYDLSLLTSKGDIRKVKYGENYLLNAIGDNKEQWQQFSPVAHAEKIKAKVLLIHGKHDERAPIEHAELMQKALEKADVPSELMVFDDETHGFYASSNQLLYFKKVLAFLDANLHK